MEETKSEKPKGLIGKLKDATEDKEHFYPKNQAKVLHHIESEYNKLIIWNGALQYHGMCMDKKWLDEWRINQVFFFQQ